MLKLIVTYILITAFIAKCWGFCDYVPSRFFFGCLCQCQSPKQAMWTWQGYSLLFFWKSFLQTSQYNSHCGYR